MNDVTCDQVRALSLDPGTPATDWTRRPEIAAHVRRCFDCRDWLEAFAAGARTWTSLPGGEFTDQVLARTSGLEAVVSDLPQLAHMDPGPGFAERVLLATSLKPEPHGWRARAAAGWWALVRRPRFAWEAAYVATVCWVLLFGNPVGAIEWSTTAIGTVARERLGPPVAELRTDIETWRARYAPVAAPAEEARGESPVPVPPIVRAWQTAAQGLSGVAAALVDAARAMWDRVTAWIGALTGAPAQAPVEPPADPARSRQ
jgi:hypothetical protein